MGKPKDSLLTIAWRDNVLTIRGRRIPGEQIDVQYLEAFCRPGSAARSWGETVIPHETELIRSGGGNTELELKSTLADGVTVGHVITARGDEVDFRLEAHNPTDRRSQAHWAQPCIRVGRFTGLADHPNRYEYIRKCFVFIDGRPTRLPTPCWATEGLYTPGQVWCPRDVPRGDVNPRPLSPLTPSNGLIGCFSADERMILATAWQPYQELFQGVITCIHSDFRIGGLEPKETKRIRGRIYLTAADVSSLLARYANDFPEHRAASVGDCQVAGQAGKGRK
jgi:hypothetical protein